MEENRSFIDVQKKKLKIDETKVVKRRQSSKKSGKAQCIVKGQGSRAQAKGSRAQDTH
jgi:hypothetical protein